MRPWCVFAVIVGTASTAHALKPGMHADVTKASCLHAGLPGDFCTRTATEDYDTDSREWDDLRAHAQIDDGETACIAADRTAARMWQLGSDMRTQLASVASSSNNSNVGDTAGALGRALHTIQDNCAHAGMPNPQHAWFSMLDFCEGTDLSPDVQDDAIRCARVETDAVMSVAAVAIDRAGVASRLQARSCPPNPNNNHNNSGPPPVCQGRFLPGPFDACSFLSRAKDWDGTDRRWESTIVGPALRDAFAAGLAGEPAPASICNGDETVLSPATSNPIVDVSGGAPSCGKSNLFCLGKADGDNPFADDPEPTAEAGGCSTTRDPASAAALFLILGALVRRRRRS